MQTLEVARRMTGWDLQGLGGQLFAGMRRRKWFHGHPPVPIAAAQVSVCALMTVIVQKESSCNCGSRAI